MLILIDLDGTLVDTVNPKWTSFKDGQENCSAVDLVNQLIFFSGAREFIRMQRDKGNSILVVSDSHPKYVKPICEYLGCDYVYLADKPNKTKLSSYLEEHPDYKELVQSGNAIFVGDTALDIELGRRMGLPTVWILPYRITDEIKNDVTKVGDTMGCLKLGPTYTAKSFNEINQIIENPIENLYTLESIFSGGESTKAIKYAQNIFRDRSYSAIRCLARQEADMCDKYARADKYYLMSSSERPSELVTQLAYGVSSYLNQPAVANQNWNYITYLTDKQTTVPPNKMKEIFDKIETAIPKVELLKWIKNDGKSLRNQNLYKDRHNFLCDHLSIDAIKNHSGIYEMSNGETLKGKNIIVIDDQLTTSATAWYVIRRLKYDYGANNVLFIALFQMILPVQTDVKCPNCGKPMQIKIRRRDGHKFYSCTPPQFKGNGCGYIMDIKDQ